MNSWKIQVGNRITLSKNKEEKMTGQKPKSENAEKNRRINRPKGSVRNQHPTL